MGLQDEMAENGCKKLGYFVFTLLGEWPQNILSSYFMPHWMRGPFKLKLNGFSYQKTNKLNLLTKVLNNRNTAAEDRVTFWDTFWYIDNI
jgi:hypothetical protein